MIVIEYRIRRSVQCWVRLSAFHCQYVSNKESQCSCRRRFSIVPEMLYNEILLVSFHIILHSNQTRHKRFIKLLFESEKFGHYG